MIAVVGYRAGWSNPELWGITNVRDPDALAVVNEFAYDSFAWCEGTREAGDEAETDALYDIVKGTRTPPRAAVGKAVEIMRAAADRPAARGMVGRSFDSATLRSDGTSPEIAHHAGEVTRSIPLPRLIDLAGGATFSGIRISTPADESPVAVPKTNPDAPCPCGSGKRYRECHGGRGGL